MRMRKWVWAGLILTGVNCVAILDGDHPYQEGDTTTQGKPCTVDANCDDTNPCTTDTCSLDTLVCEYLTQADGLAPDLAQIGADCQKLQCMSGKPVQQEDPEDTPNDNNSCTTDACIAGVPTNDVMPDGSSCSQGEKTGECAAGTCTIACANNNDCDDANPCSEDLCNTSSAKCVFTFLDGVPTPGFAEVAENCKLHLCLNGIDTEINDEADINDDGNSCTTDVCNNGVPENNNVPEATSCTPGDVNVCDGNGACVECTLPSHCVGIIETECEKRNCVANKCEIAYEGQGTLASPVLQAANDCKKVVCNGPAGTTTVNDDADLPNDSKPCTTDTCSNGSPVFTNNAQGTSCGSNQVCNATGGCVGCNAPSDCAGTDTFCQARTCINNVCGFSFTANGTDLPTGQTAGDCKVLECNGMGNVKTSVLQSDVPVDGNACTQDLCNGQGTPSNPPTAINSACSVGMNTVCDGNGTCKKSLGTACGAGNECVTANCVDGYCCNTSCATTCQSCNVAGKLGTCSDVPKGSPDTGCSGANQGCNGPNNCDFVNGQPCATNSACLNNFCADGICCNSACDTVCKSCNVAGSVGTCSNLPSGSVDNVPTNLCVGSNQCDGNGVCKKVNGAACVGAAECLSGNCVDGVCCANACTTTCLACNVPGSAGSCVALPMDNDDTFPANACTGTMSCDGAAQCKLKPGQACMTNSQCTSNACVGGMCLAT
jgi:hypothetical protein